MDTNLAGFGIVVASSHQRGPYVAPQVGDEDAFYAQYSSAWSAPAWSGTIVEMVRHVAVVASAAGSQARRAALSLAVSSKPIA
jgi:hypothetical protein